MTESVNPTLTLVENLFKSIVWDTLLKLELAALFAANPWMNIWPLRQIITGLATLVTDKIFSVLRLVVDVQAISIINAAAQSAFVAATVKLKIIAHDKGVGSDEFKAQKILATNAFAKFVKYNTG